MRFALILATLVAGALAAPFEELDQDSVSLPDFKFDLSAREVQLHQGKVEGFSEALRPGRGCYGRYKCDVFVSGLRVSYKAVATEPEQKLDVVVDVLHGLLNVESRKTAEGQYEVKNVRVKALHQYVREPVQFSTDRKQNVLFDEKLKQKLVELLKQVALTDRFNDALNKVLGIVDSKSAARESFEVTGKPFETVYRDHVAFPDFELSVFGNPTRNVTFTKGKAGALSTVLKPTPECLGDYKCVLSLRGLRVTYKAVATEPEEQFELTVDVVRCLVEVERSKTKGGNFTLGKVTVKDLHVYVKNPVEFSSDRAQNTVFENELKKKLLEFLEVFTWTEVFNHALNKGIKL